MEISMPWDGKTVGDSGPYTSDQWSGIYRGMSGDAPNAGVILTGDTDNFGLTVGTNSVTIGTGKAMVYGRYYENNAEVALPFSTPAATRYDLVVLRATWIDNKIRLVYREGVDGGTEPPSLIQSAGSVWEIPLWVMVITNTTQSAYRDVRKIWQDVTLFYSEQVLSNQTSSWSISGIPASCGKIQVVMNVYRIEGWNGTLRLRVNGMVSADYDYEWDSRTYLNETYHTLTTLEDSYFHTVTVDIVPIMTHFLASAIPRKVWVNSFAANELLGTETSFGVVSNVVAGDISLLFYQIDGGEFLVGSSIKVYVYS